MLIENFLPNYHYREIHSIKIVSASADIYQQMMNCDLRQSLIIKFLFRIRGIPAELSTIKDITRLGFIQLDEKQGEEILYGMVTNSPTFSGCEMIKSSSEFINQENDSIIKAVINFRVCSELPNHLISTETRVWCGSRMRKGFRLYWFFVKPFSQIIRRLMLYQMKKQLSK